MASNTEVIDSIMRALGIPTDKPVVTGFELKVGGCDERPLLTVEKLVLDEVTEDGDRPRITEQVVMVPIDEYRQMEEELADLRAKVR